jgi:signal transduction histidine kinase
MAEHRPRLVSVRVRTALAATLVVGVALTLGGVVLLRLLAGSLRAGVDSSARLQADALATLAQRGNLPELLGARGDDTAFVQVVSADGRVLAASTNVEGEPPLVADRSVPADGVVRSVRSLPIGDQGTFRLALRAVPTTAGTVVVVAGGSLGPAQHTIRTLVAALAGGLPLLLGVVAVTAWILAGRALAPVEAIRSQVAEISTRALDKRLPDLGGRDEIARLATTMNEMLARLDASVRRQRQFVADASHELRSPLAAALAELDVDLAHPEAAEWTATAQGVRAELERMGRLVEDLLVMARADETPLQRRRRPVDLADVVLSGCAHLRANAKVLVDDDGVDAVQVLGDHDQLRRMVANLLTNAARHARTRITVTLTEGQAGAELIVADDGPGIPADQRKQIFERFARLDEARARDAGGTGLGLAIAKQIVDAHHGDIGVTDASPGAHFAVVLPTTPRIPGKSVPARPPNERMTPTDRAPGLGDNAAASRSSGQEPRPKGLTV